MFYLNNKLKEILNFLIVGILNASIYFSLLTIIEIASGCRYIALLISQTLISIIAFYNFSKYSFKVDTKKIHFYKFLVSNSLIFVFSSLIAIFLESYKLSPYLFGLILILIITPISYLLNSRFVFIKK